MRQGDLVRGHEGLRLKVYRCPTGYLTIGYGRNLETNGISKREAIWLLDEDMIRVEAGLSQRIPWWRSLDEVRRAILVDMGINLGVAGLLEFKRMLRALRNGNHVTAAMEMVNSRWSKQVGARSDRLVEMMLSGQWPDKETNHGKDLGLIA